MRSSGVAAAGELSAGLNTRSRMGATATAPAVLVAALAALAYA